MSDSDLPPLLILTRQASRETLESLVVQLAQVSTAQHRECLNFLVSHTASSQNETAQVTHGDSFPGQATFNNGLDAEHGSVMPAPSVATEDEEEVGADSRPVMPESLLHQAAAQAVFPLWETLLTGLQEINAYGGSDELHEGLYDQVWDLEQTLLKHVLSPDDRKRFFESYWQVVWPAIAEQTTNHGRDLIAIGFAACKQEGEWRELALQIQQLIVHEMAEKQAREAASDRRQTNRLNRFRPGDTTNDSHSLANIPAGDIRQAGMKSMTSPAGFSSEQPVCVDTNDDALSPEGWRNQWFSSWAVEFLCKTHLKLDENHEYLRLREATLHSGDDYLDLAGFYARSGDMVRAKQVAEQGLREAKEPLAGLRRFLADHAIRTGDRTAYLDLLCDQINVMPELETYLSFKAQCTPEEWAVYEPRIVAALPNAWGKQQVLIRMHRQEFTEAFKALYADRLVGAHDDSDLAEAADLLDKRYPDDMLEYYLRCLRHESRSAKRSAYTRQAHIMVRIHRLLTIITHNTQRWIEICMSLKQENRNRPAFREEFARIVPGWREL